MARVCHSLAACQRHTSSSLAAVIGLSNNDVISLRFVRSLRCVRCVGWKLRFSLHWRIVDVDVQGSPGYWPPEVLEQRPFNPRTADVWALGVTLHVLLTSRLPFGADVDLRVDEDRALTMMRRGLDLGPSGPSRSVRLSTPVIELLRGLLHYVTEVSRPTTSHVVLTSSRSRVHYASLNHAQLALVVLCFHNFRAQSVRGLSTILHCLQLYKLVLRTRLSTPTVQYLIHSEAYFMTCTSSSYHPVP